MTDKPIDQMEQSSHITEAVRWLKRAIDRHRKHMSGDEPTSEDSQKRLMAEMETTLEHLNLAQDADAKTENWVDILLFGVKS